MKTDRGFTLIELLVVAALFGLLTALAMPFLDWDRPLRSSVVLFQDRLLLISHRSRTTGRVYRLRPKFTNVSSYPGGVANLFEVDSAVNCQVADGSGWRREYPLDLSLASRVRVATNPLPSYDSPSTISTVANFLSWSVCFTPRGDLDVPVAFTLEDTSSKGRSSSARLVVGAFGLVSLTTYDRGGNVVSTPSQTPIY